MRTEVAIGNVLFTMVNTDPNCFWLTNFLETLLVQVNLLSSTATEQLCEAFKTLCV